MLNACMIDGFGSFRGPDYRRTWLLFDSVEYIFPIYVSGVMPNPSVYFRKECTVVEPAGAADEVAERIDRARRSAADSEYSSFVLASFPERDLDYALNLVGLDSEVKALAGAGWPTSPVEAMAFLVDKLLDHAETKGLVPIAGQKNAADLITRTVQMRSDSESSLAPGALVTPRQGVNFHAFAAGLSLDFLSDDDLLRPSIDDLLRFKESHEHLRQRHQLELVSVAQQFDGFPADSSFHDHLAELRVKAQKERLALNAEARDAWKAAGFRLLEKAMLAGAGGAVTALGLIGTASLSTLAAHAVPAVAASLGLAAASATGAFVKARRARRKGIAYLLDAQQYLRG